MSRHITRHEQSRRIRKMITAVIAGIATLFALNLASVLIIRGIFGDSPEWIAAALGAFYAYPAATVATRLWPFRTPRHPTRRAQHVVPKR